MNAMKVEFIYQVRVSMNDLGDTFTSESLLTEAALDIVEHFGMGRVRFVQEILESEIRSPETVAEVLCEYPAAVYRTHIVSNSSCMVRRMTHRRR